MKIALLVKQYTHSNTSMLEIKWIKTIHKEENIKKIMFNVQRLAISKKNENIAYKELRNKRKSGNIFTSQILFMLMFSFWMKMENDIDKSLGLLGIRFAYPSNFQWMSIFDPLDSHR